MNSEIMQAYLESVRDCEQPERVALQSPATDTPQSEYALWIESLAAQASMRRVN
jgi:hypothetical protein